MNNDNNILGIWGIGIGNSAVIRALHAKIPMIAYDNNELNDEKKTFLKECNVPLFKPEERELFCARATHILPSSGVNTQHYAIEKDKIIKEIDLFYQYWKKPIIGITGSIGKTTTTHLASQLLAQSSSTCATGGNIGTGMFDLLTQTNADYALLELSSFQLESCRFFAPHVAIITNIYPNHLDRHGSFEDYAQAKYRIYQHQTPSDYTLMPHALKNIAPQHNHHRRYFCITRPLELEAQTVYYATPTELVKEHATVITPLLDRKKIPHGTFLENWIILAALCDMLNIEISRLIDHIEGAIPHHRLALVDTHHEIAFYNDSKSTIWQSTAAAVDCLSRQPLIVLIGGISKGVDRRPLMKALKGKVKAIITFGAEAILLKQYADEEEIPSHSCSTLHDAFTCSVTLAKKGDQVLLSPAGASYDLFAHYQERGEQFISLVRSLKNHDHRI